MNFKLSQNTIIFLGSLTVAVILFVAIFQGVKAGKATAQANAVILVTQNFSAGLEYFYQDQNRFPNVLEFNEQNLMLNYFNVFPFPKFISALCTESFEYKKNSNTSVILNFCLPKSAGTYQAGWNTLTLNK